MLHACMSSFVYSKHSVEGTLVEGKEQPMPPPPPPQPIKVQPTACPTKELVSVSPPVPSRVSVASQTCEKKVMVDALAIVSCPEGFEDVGEICLKETTISPKHLCLSNGATEGVCPPVIQKHPKVVQCSNGEKPVDGKCINVQSAPAENLCAEGFKDTGAYRNVFCLFLRMCAHFKL